MYRFNQFNCQHFNTYITASFNKIRCAYKVPRQKPECRNVNALSVCFTWSGSNKFYKWVSKFWAKTEAKSNYKIRNFRNLPEVFKDVWSPFPWAKMVVSVTGLITDICPSFNKIRCANVAPILFKFDDSKNYQNADYYSKLYIDMCRRNDAEPTELHIRLPGSW